MRGYCVDPAIGKFVAKLKGRTAKAEMERQRKPLEDNCHDIGLDDDGIWTEVDGSYTGRRDNVTIQVTQPPDKIMKLKAAKAFFEGL